MIFMCGRDVKPILNHVNWLLYLYDMIIIHLFSTELNFCYNILPTFVENIFLRWTSWQTNINCYCYQLLNVKRTIAITILIWTSTNKINTYLASVTTKFDLITVNLTAPTNIHQNLLIKYTL